jgi:amino acid adenylation domain-containing protein
MEQKVIQLIAGITGHEPGDLSADMELEAELGFDSIKSIELFTKLQECLPDKHRAHFIETLNQKELMCLASIADVSQYLQAYVDSNNTLTTVNEDSSSSKPFVESRNAVLADSVDVEVLQSQLIFLVAHWAVSNCSLCTRIQLEGTMELELLQQSWGRLLKRHPSIRGHFTIPKTAKNTSLADYRFTIQNQLEAPQLKYTDLQELSNTQQQKYLLDIVAEKTAYEWDINSGLLHAFEVIELAENVFEIVFYNHHLISDGLSNQKIVEEFIHIYDALLANKEVVFSSTYQTNEYNDAVKYLNQWQDADERRKLQSYLQQQGRNSFIWNPIKSEANKGSVQHINRLFKLSKDHTNRIIQQAGQARLSLNSIMTAVYLQRMAQIAPELDEVIINIPTSGRIYPNVSLFNMVGCFAQNLALSFKLPAANTLKQEFIEQVQLIIHDAIANGMDRAQTSEMTGLLKRLPIVDERTPQSVDKIVNSSVKSNVFLSFIGHTHFNETKKVKLRDYHPATTTSVNTIDTLVEFFDGQMLLAVNADAAYFGEDFISEFGTGLIKILEEVTLSSKDQKIIAENKPQIDASKTLLSIASKVLNKEFHESDFDKDLESEVGMDSLERIRIISGLRAQYNNIVPQELMQARSLYEMAQKIPANEILDMPYSIITHQCKQTPNAIAIQEGSQMMSYAELDAKSNRMAQFLRSQGVGKDSIVAIMSKRSIEMVVGVMGILKAGGAYLPVDPDYPAVRIEYILSHSKAAQILLNTDDFSQLDAAIKDNNQLETIICLNKNLAQYKASKASKIELDRWIQASDEPLDIINTKENLMCVLYTSGSTGNPKGVTLTHKGYSNRLKWMQKTFNLGVGDRVAHKTSCCFDISVWEIFWPLMYGATICPVQNETVSNPWALAEWLIESKINVIHFVPSLFGEFLNIIENENYKFNDLNWMVFSGEVLPVSFMHRWIDKYALNTGLANLYGPTEASIDVTCYMIDSKPAQDLLRLPIGKPVDNTSIHIMDENMNRLPQGQEGELWIAGTQLATGYLFDRERSDKAFIKNPFEDIDSGFLYKSGDLAVQLEDGNFDYRGRTDNQIKIRGYRVELGEIEAILDQHSAVNNCVVIDQKDNSGNIRLYACISADIHAETEQQLREYCAEKLPHYMVPHRFEFFADLPKTSNGKLDRKAVKMKISNNQESLPTTSSKAEGNIEQSIPVGPAQKWLLHYFEQPYNWCGYSRFIYNNHIDIKTFEQSITSLVNDHEMFRTVFDKADGLWQQRILPEGQGHNVICQDTSSLTQEQRDTLIQQDILDACNSLNIRELPLFKVRLYKIHAQCYEIAVIAHHLIADMLSSSKLFTDLWSNYAAISHGKLPAKKNHLQYREFVQSLPQNQSEIKELSHFWHSYLSANERLKLTVDHNYGENLESSASSKDFSLSKSETTEFQKKAKSKFKTSVYHTLLGPLYRLMSEISGQESILISHRSHGRIVGDSREFLNTIGDFACNFPVAVNLQEINTATQLITAISNEFAKIPMNGVSYDWVSDQLLADNLYPDNKLTPVRVNYLGIRDLPQSKLFELKPEHYDSRFAPPQQKRTCDLEFILFISEGCLNLRLEYSSNQYTESSIEKIGNRYMHILQEFLQSSSLPDFRLVETKNKIPNMPQIDRTAVVITNADCAFGKKLALSLIANGIDVYITGKHQDILSEIADENPAITSLGRVDLRFKHEIEQLLDKLNKDNVQLNAWVNSHDFQGVSPVSASIELSQSVLENRVTAMINSCHSVLTYFKHKNHGQVINVLSELAFLYPPKLAAHAAAEHAIKAYSCSLAAEVAVSGLQVNCVCPSVLSQNFKIREQQQNQTISLITNLVTMPYVNGECFKLFESFESDSLLRAEAIEYRKGAI